jgi:3-deoxy-manno-octulosonate cytidylyltransferase (CMP-KDO synthetase)
MKIVGVIPCRFGSTRFPGKPLALISGKPMLEWVLRGVKSSQLVQEFIVATDHQAIFDLAQHLGFRAVMTPSDLPSGSDRVWSAIENEDIDVALNIQGDEPLISGESIDALARPFLLDSKLEMATLGRQLREGDLESATTAKIILNQKNEALYFSRCPIPYTRKQQVEQPGACLKHIGLYGYKKSFLKRFCSEPPAAIELAEGLEQLRALYLGARIQVIEVDHDSWGVDVPEDILKIETLLNKRGLV